MLIIENDSWLMALFPIVSMKKTTTHFIFLQSLVSSSNNQDNMDFFLLIPPGRRKQLACLGGGDPRLASTHPWMHQCPWSIDVHTILLIRKGMAHVARGRFLWPFMVTNIITKEFETFLLPSSWGDLFLARHWFETQSFTIAWKKWKKATLGLHRTKSMHLRFF